MNIVLHQWEISPYCGKVRRILRHKRLDFETRNYNGLEALRVRKLTRPGRLPVLDYADQRITDISRIAAFIEQRHPEYPLLPADEALCALALMWEDWADESLFWFEVYFRVHDAAALAASDEAICAGRSAWERHLITPMFRRDYQARLRAQGLGCRSELEVDQLFGQHLDRLDTILSRSARLVGESTTIADIAVAAMLDEIVRTSKRRNAILARPHLRDWLYAMAA